jgi:hypothetical protein
MVITFDGNMKLDLPRPLQPIRQASGSLKKVMSRLLIGDIDSDLFLGRREERSVTSMAMEIMSQQVPEEDTEAVALATIIFAAGFFLGIGTGMLLGSGAGSGVRGRLKHVVDDLMGGAAKGLTGATETGKQMLTKEGMPGRS